MGRDSEERLSQYNPIFGNTELRNHLPIILSLEIKKLKLCFDLEIDISMLLVVFLYQTARILFLMSHPRNPLDIITLSSGPDFLPRRLLPDTFQSPRS